MIRNGATQAQVDAADPGMSTWLSANAGSGKTRVLTDRVARLLLAGTEPQNILCLTYTKAAASEMQNRLFRRLGAWAMMPSVALREQLAELGVDAALGPDFLSQARKLFAAAIETPGGLKIQTIHSFCAGILRRFPLEAGVSPGFREMEEHESDLLRQEVLESMALGADRDVVDVLARHYTGAEINTLLQEIAGKKQAFLPGVAEQDIAGTLGLPPKAERSAAMDIAFDGSEAEVAAAVAEAFADQSKTYQEFAANLLELPLKTPTDETLHRLFDLLLYADKSSKSRNFPQSNHKKAVEAVSHCVDALHAWMDRVAEANDYLRQLTARDRSVALHRFAKAFVERYDALKTRRGLLDFDDLILRTRQLLTDPMVAQWVLFRLDGGVDHILIDEGQDTSPEQWKIVELLTQEFTVGEGARSERDRTIFVVGDKKQSIYSFQGADPEGFDRMRGHFGKALTASGAGFAERELLYSFRSSAAILQLVDTVFDPQRNPGLDIASGHLAFHPDMPGRVDLWPVIEPVKAPEPPWDDPLDQKTDADQTIRLARQIADEMARMIAEEHLVVKDGDRWVRRPVTEGDFLILVRRRGELFNEIIAASKARGLRVAGADRMKLGEELAVKDILALLSFLALPEDDLSLAAALKSPLFGWTEKQLYDLAQPRPDGQTLWEAFRKSDTIPAETARVIDDLRQQSDYLRPYDLINRILIRHDGRRNLVARLGAESEDGIDALLAQALAYERGTVPSLTGFLAWLEAEEIEIKRQMDSAGDRIRVMTVHGAKGLEAPIVILPDTAKRKRDLRNDLLTGDGPVMWKPKAEDMPTKLAEWRDAMLAAEDREFARLLYVALTRAESWIIIAAAGDVGKSGDGWYATVAEAMPHLETRDVELPFGVIQRHEYGDWSRGDSTRQDRDVETVQPEPGFGRDLPKVPLRQMTLSPSDLGGAKALPGETDATEEESLLAHGRLIHLLLEHLAGTDPANRPETARLLIDTHPDAALVDDTDALIADALTMLSAPDLREIFQSGLTEVEITAPLLALGNARIHGAIDRLVVSDRCVLAIDYKSNRIVPSAPAQVPDGLLRQMAAYRDALRQVYPDHTVETALLWTRTGGLMPLPDDLLTEALARVTLA